MVVTRAARPRRTTGILRGLPVEPPVVPAPVRVLGLPVGASAAGEGEAPLVPRSPHLLGLRGTDYNSSPWEVI